ncbi:MAG: LLM class flavin-dependent oxidoreductase [Deltaproteobacteria bacterium]|nr:LLM class flavin-dependent oxidoreductase [Deltaproteobacteria bacterium]MBW2362744.1 LLM class flavin-dependent oxidoreductase [Deltaproteobacteria bacterium]
MAHWILRLDMRAPEFGAAPAALYAAALQMAEWADAQGFDEIMLSEHHGSPDGYLPSPLAMAAAIAARTQRVRIRISALVLPLHDPLRIAEDVAVVDQLSGGRIELVIVGGFLRGEFELFDRPFERRGRSVEAGLALLERAWSGEPFEHEGRRIHVTPRPLQRPRPPILLGGSSEHAARRAARLADGFVPALPGLYPAYEQACRARGRSPAPDRQLGPGCLHVAEDPDAAWATLAPHALHETNSYGRWYAEGVVTGPYEVMEDADALRAAGSYRVVTPDECIALARELGDDVWLFVHPLLAGLDPEEGWKSLELLAAKVLPALR